MRGGELLVEGDAGDWAGVALRGGRLVVRGSAGDQLGGAYPGDRAGMRGGEIIVHGDAGAQAGDGLRRGLIAVGGDAGDGAGLRMLAGTIVASATLGAQAGAGDAPRHDRRHDAASTLLPTFALACAYRPPFLRLVLRRLRALGLPSPTSSSTGATRRWCGDALELRRGEILILESRAHDASLNDRALALVDQLVADAEAAARGGRDAPRRDARRSTAASHVPGGLEAGRLLRRDLHGRAGHGDRRAAGRSASAGCPALTVRTDHPARRLPGRAVRGLEARPRRLLRDGQRARARADPRRGPLRRPRLGGARGRSRVLCLETREPPPAQVAERRGARRRRARRR